MSEKNVQVVRDFISAANSGKIERIRALCSADCVVRGLPYVGCGLNVDDADGKRLIVKGILPGAPSSGKLLEGDEILSVRDGDTTYDGYEAIRVGIWGQGTPGLPVEFKVRRGGKDVSVTVIRGKIPAYSIPMTDVYEGIASFYRDWPDHHEDIESVVDGGDYITLLSTVTGTNGEFARGAFWSSFTLYRVRDGKIVELCGLDDTFSQLKQLGYSMIPPSKDAVC